MEASSNAVYFRSYEELSVHELMIKDKPRTDGYRDAIEANREQLQGKTVMDVGAGTGILSLFAARAGAKKVHAVEASGMAQVTREIVRANKLEEIIEVHECRVEDLQLPGDGQVDVIISEWMGFYLLHESMLNSVVYARDRFLRSDGLMFPSSAQIHAAAICMDDFYQSKIDFWKDVYGFDFSPLIPAARQAAVSTEAVTDVTAEQIITNSFLVSSLDLTTVKMEELQHLEEEAFFAVQRAGHFHAFCLWFDVHFPTPATHTEGDLVLSTAPGVPSTHWQQFVIKMPEPMLVEKDATMEAKFTFTQDQENPRFYNVTAQLTDLQPPDEPMEEVAGSGIQYSLPGHEDQCGCMKCVIARAFISENGGDEGDVDIEL